MGVFALLRLGRMLNWSQGGGQPLEQYSIHLSSLPWGQASPVLLMRGIQASHSPAFSPSISPCIPCVGHQDWGTQDVASTSHSPGQISNHVISLFP